jgi:hypothetical protein
MSFIDKFLDVTTNLPREIVRILKLYKSVEERSKKINDDLKNLREKYLKEIKETKDTKENNNETILYTNEKYYKELLNLSDYKQSLIDELKFILENDFLKKLEPIIDEGQKECQEQLLSSNINLPYGANSFTNSIYNKQTSEERSLSEYGEKKKKNEKLLGQKTNRTNKNKSKKNLELNNEFSEDVLPDGEEFEVFCTCKRQSFGKMIACETCGRWFHFGCVGIAENNEPEKWFCADCKASMNNNTVKKKKKKH